MSAPVRPSAARLAVAVILPLAVFSAIYYSSGGNLGGRELRLTAEGPGEVAPAAGPVSVPLTLNLENRSGGAITLSAADPCKVFRWVVQKMDDTSVQSKGNACTPAETSRTIASGETFTHTETITLDGHRLEAGQSYKIIVQLYGQDGAVTIDMASP
ncbi:MAG: hypothetical protein QM698_02020 [Micropepsaceae bacterium]